MNGENIFVLFSYSFSGLVVPLGKSQMVHQITEGQRQSRFECIMLVCMYM
jgi:hypothetical protein